MRTLLCLALEFPDLEIWVLSWGLVSFISSCRKNPFFSDGIWGPYNNAVVPGLYCLEGGQVSAGSIASWFLREFKVESDQPYENNDERGSTGRSR